MIKRTITTVILILITIFILNGLNHTENILPNKPFSTFPTRIGEWQGKESKFDEKIYEILGVDDSFLASYSADASRSIQLYIGFYQSQKEGDIIHSPKNCMPGAGWIITKSKLVDVDLPGTETGKMTVVNLSLENSGQKQVVLYWFQSRGRIISSEYMQKIYLVMDSITKQRTDGSFVRLITPVVNGNEAEALESLKGFTRKIVPFLNEYIPL